MKYLLQTKVMSLAYLGWPSFSCPPFSVNYISTACSIAGNKTVTRSQNIATHRLRLIHWGSHRAWQRRSGVKQSLQTAVNKLKIVFLTSAFRRKKDQDELKPLMDYSIIPPPSVLLCYWRAIERIDSIWSIYIYLVIKGKDKHQLQLRQKFMLFPLLWEQNLLVTKQLPPLHTQQPLRNIV